MIDWKNKKSVLAVIQEHGLVLKYADKSLKNDSDIIKAVNK